MKVVCVFVSARRDWTVGKSGRVASWLQRSSASTSS